METKRFLFTALSIIAPQYAIRVMQARMMQRLYEGAQTYPGSDWQSVNSNTSANTEIGLAQSILMSKSRDLARNNPYAIKASDVIVSNTIGAGIVPKIKGRTKRQEKEIKRLWKEIADSNLVDAERRHDFYTLQSLAMNIIVESGEVLAITSITQEAPSIQLMEPDFIDSSKKNTGNKDGSGRIVNGIVVDKNSRRTGYYLFDSHPGDMDRISSTSESKLISADNVLHIYKQTRAGQLRGVPWSHAILETLKDFADFQYATIVRQKISACLVGVITSNGSDSLLTNTQKIDKRKAETKMTPGSFKYAEAGEDVKFSTPPTPQGYSEFIGETIRSVACGYGITYESISNDYSRVNFSSGRMGHLEMKRNIEKWRWCMIIPHFCNPYWKIFLKWCEAKGVDIKGVEVEWVPPAFNMIDPSKEIKALREEVRAGFKTFGQAVRELGLDPDDLVIEHAEWNKQFDNLKLSFDSDARRMSNVGFAHPKDTLGLLSEAPYLQIPSSPNTEPAQPKNNTQPVDNVDEDEDEEDEDSSY